MKVVMWCALWMNMLQVSQSIQMQAFMREAESCYGKDYLPSEKYDLIQFSKNVLKLENNPNQLSQLYQRREKLFSNNKWWAKKLGARTVEKMIKGWIKNSSEFKERIAD
jgi:hypothetical protein